ncbi:MAG: MaoC family dehydratase [Sphingomonadaceae bacterium]
MIYLEDLAPGRTERFGEYRVSREEVLEFARKYDPQPFHLSDEVAAQTPFGRIAASGWHTGAMTMRMLVERWWAAGLQGLGSPGIEELRWLRPVFPGDTLSVEAEILATRPSRSRPGIGLFKARVTTLNQTQEPVMTHVATVMIRRRPAE